MGALLRMKWVGHMGDLDKKVARLVDRIILLEENIWNMQENFRKEIVIMEIGILEINLTNNTQGNSF